MRGKPPGEWEDDGDDYLKCLDRIAEKCPGKAALCDEIRRDLQPPPPVVNQHTALQQAAAKKERLRKAMLKSFESQAKLKKQLDEQQWRAAAHWYFLRNIGVVSLVYKNRQVQNTDGPNPNVVQSVALEANYRF